jgi:hypothetical protein
MRIEGDPIPFRAAQAYGVTPNTRVEPVKPVQRQAMPERSQATGRVTGPEVRTAPSKIDRLVGAIVPGGIDFSEPAPKPSAPKAALPFYEKPGQRNEVATTIVANTGRTLDVRG